MDSRPVHYQREEGHLPHYDGTQSAGLHLFQWQPRLKPKASDTIWNASAIYTDATAKQMSYYKALCTTAQFSLKENVIDVCPAKTLTIGPVNADLPHDTDYPDPIRILAGF